MSLIVFTKFFNVCLGFNLIEINKVSIYLLFMELLVAFRDDPAGYNMAKFISKNMHKKNEIFHSENFDLLIIDTPSISADLSLIHI